MSDTLNNILAKILAYDDDLIELSQAECKELDEALKGKVDNYKELIDRIESEVDRTGRRIAEMQAKKTSLTKAVDRIRKGLLFVMKSKDSFKLPGNDYQVLRTATSRVKTTREPEDVDVIKYPEYVRISFAWKKSEIATALKNKKDLPFAEIDEGESIKFLLRKNV